MSLVYSLGDRGNESGSEVREEDGDEIGGYPFRALLRMDELRVVKKD